MGSTHTTNVGVLMSNKEVKNVKEMKKISILWIALACVLQVNAQRPIRFEVKVPSMNCEECEAIIENALWKRVDGITEIDAKWRAKKVVIKYVPDRIDSVNIKLLIAGLGFDASDEKAEEAPMTRLPKCCQRVVVAKPVEPIKPTPPIPAPAPKATEPTKPVSPVNPKTPTTTKPTVVKPSTGQGSKPVAKPVVIPVAKPVTPSSKKG